MREARRFVAVLVAVAAAVTFASAGPAAASPTCKGLSVTIQGGPQDERLRGTRGRDVIHAGPGDDVVLGRGGIDVVCGGPGRDVVSGGAGADRVFGNDQADVVAGGPGNDFLDGGSGHDAAAFQSAKRALTIDLAERSASGQGLDALVSVESAVGGRGDDVISGTRKTNVLVGGLGDDRLLGLGGTDVLEPLEGDDFVDGGPGKDVLSYSLSSGAVAVHPRRGDGSQRVRSTEALQGSPFPDVIRGTDGDDVLLGGLGGDQFRPGGGDDLVDGQGPRSDLDEVVYDDAPRGVAVALEIERVRGHRLGEATGDGHDALVDIDGAVGSRFDDVLAGGTAPVTLAGLAGDDEIDVGVGEATGGHGADVIVGEGRLLGDEGNDVLRARGSSEIAGGPGHDVLDGSPGLDVLVPGPGDDTVDGSSPTDAGGRTFSRQDTVSFAAAAGAVVVSLTTGEASGEGDDSLTDVEDVEGSLFDDVIQGNELQNHLFGGGGADRIDAMGGDDLVDGGAGDDSLTGGDGDDFLSGNEGTDDGDGGPGTDGCDVEQPVGCESSAGVPSGRQASRWTRHLGKIGHAMAEIGSVAKAASPISASTNLNRLVAPR